ncbi:MAG: PIN domain-containing protein [Prochlorococcaceae cyanobacterium]
MLTLDTNVVVRLLIGDDPQQTPLAERAFLDAIAGGGVYLPDVVLAEVAWVLRGYDQARASSAGALPVLSFDRRFSASAGVELLLPG